MTKEQLHDALTRIGERALYLKTGEVSADYAEVDDRVDTLAAIVIDLAAIVRRVMEVS